jgi:hypothetical protein
MNEQKRDVNEQEKKRCSLLPRAYPNDGFERLCFADEHGELRRDDLLPDVVVKVGDLLEPQTEAVETVRRRRARSDFRVDRVAKLCVASVVVVVVRAQRRSHKKGPRHQRERQ